MLDKDAYDIEKLRISCKLTIFQNKTCVKDPSVTQKNEIYDPVHYVFHCPSLFVTLYKVCQDIPVTLYCAGEASVGG